MNFLKYLNSLPFPLTIKHYFTFEESVGLKNNELNSSESWDTIRQSDPHFSISESREEWLKASENIIRKDGQDGGLIKRSEDAINIIDKLGINSVFSVGVGGAGLEYQIKKRRPSIKMTCSEYSPISVERLKKVFIECENIILFDIKSKDWTFALAGSPPEKQLCLMYRVDINFNDGEMREIFENMNKSGVENILIILCGCITAKGIYNRLKQRLFWRIHGVKYVFSGYLRTKKTFLGFWKDLYDYEEFDFAGLPGFLLKKKKLV